MSFSTRIQQALLHGVECARAYVRLVVLGPGGEVGQRFRFDTGADFTTVSEDVAAALGLPAGGTPTPVGGATGTATGRLVDVTFRFPPDAVSGAVRVPVSSTWLVLGGRRNVALLGLQDVHRHFTLSTDDDFMYFVAR
jgi:hypothetical protein